MKDIVKVLFSQDSLAKNENKSICRFRCIVSVILCVSAFFMLIMNIKNHSTDMVWASVILVVGFFISAIVAGVFKNEQVSAVIIAALVALVLSQFAVSGGNQGFAILWILLVPLFAINLLGITAGFFVSTYFLFFLIVIFYTGASSLIEGKYTDAFVSRFPILYMSDYLIATIFSVQREYYHRSLKRQAYTDGLTGAYNRRFCMEQLQRLDNEKNTDYVVIAIDLNGLKTVNDTMGHDAGDEIIKAVIECCDEAFDKSDIVCRMGGDEYTVIAFGDKECIDGKIDRLKKCSKKWTGKLVETVSFAVGIAFYEEGLTYMDLLKKADAEMYNDKMLYYKDEKNNRRKR